MSPPLAVEDDFCVQVDGEGGRGRARKRGWLTRAREGERNGVLKLALSVGSVGHIDPSERGESGEG